MDLVEEFTVSKLNSRIILHPDYTQFNSPEFQPYMNILDLLFNCGDRSLEISGFKELSSFLSAIKYICFINTDSKYPSHFKSFQKVFFFILCQNYVPQERISGLFLSFHRLELRKYRIFASFTIDLGKIKFINSGQVEGSTSKLRHSTSVTL